MPDTKLPALTAISAPALDDLLYIVDVSDLTDDASGSSRDITIERLLAVGLHGICHGRLTTETGVAVSTSDRTDQSTLYFTPLNGNRIALYDGTRWGLFAFSERSLTLSGLTSARNYDVFLYNNAGTLTLELSAAWTNDTTRADALTTQDGILVKSGATTRRYIGTIRATGTTTTEDSMSKRFVWNLYNQTQHVLRRTESTVSWTLGASVSWRNWNNSSTNRVEVVIGIGGSWLDLAFNGMVAGVPNNGTAHFSIGEDASVPNTGIDVGRYGGFCAQTMAIQSVTRVRKIPTAGYHFYQALESSDNTTGTCTIYGTEAASGLRWVMGLLGSIES